MIARGMPRSLALVVWLLCAWGASAQPQAPLAPGPVGAPPVRRLAPGGDIDPQEVWSLAQSGSGRMFVASTLPALVFHDGVGYHPVDGSDAVGGGSPWSCVAATPDGRVFAAGFGRLARIEERGGTVRCIDLAGEPGLGPGRVIDCQRILAYGNTVAFVSPTCIHVLREGERWQVVEGSHEQVFGAAAVVDDRPVVWQGGVGLITFGAGDERPRVLAGSEVVATLSPSCLVAVRDRSADSQVLLAHRDGSVLRFAEGEVERAFRVPLPGADDMLTGLAQNRESGWLAATVRGGLLELDAEGRLLRAVGERDGLPAAHVTAVTRRRDHEVWVGTTRGIAVVDLEAGVERYGRADGLAGAPLACTMLDGRLFVGTPSGVYRSVADGGAGAPGRVRFESIEGLDSGWALAVTPGRRLVAATASSLAVVDGGAAAEPLCDLDVACLLARSDGSVLAGGRGGVWSLRVDDPADSAARTTPVPVPALGDAVGWLVPGPESDEVWSLAQDGRLVLARVPSQSPDTAEVLAREQLSPGIGMLRSGPGRRALLLVAGGVFEPAVSDGGGIRLRPMAGLELPDLLGSLSDLAAPSAARIWLSDGRSLFRCDAQTGTHEWIAAVGGLLDDRVTLFALAEDPTRLWVGGRDRLLAVHDAAPQFRSGAVQLSLILDRASGDPMPDELPVELPTDESVRGRLAIDLVDAAGPTTFRCRLRAADAVADAVPAWGSWSREGRVEFGPLAAGSYVFDIEARTPRRAEVETLEWRFEVCAPWWRTDLFHVLLAVALVMLGLAGVSLRSRWLRNRNRELEAEVARQLRTVEAERDGAQRSASWARATFDASPVAMIDEDVSRVEQRLQELGLQDPDELIELLDTDEPLRNELLGLIRVRAVNRAAVELFGASNAPELILRIGELAGPEAIPLFVRKLAALRSGARIFEEHSVLRRLDGTSIQVRFACSSVPGPESGTRRQLLTIVDETARLAAEEERQRIAEQMQASQRLESLGVLAGGLAHDFNNLLTVVRGGAGIVEGRATDTGDPELEEAARSIDLAAHRAGDLCHQLLTYAGCRVPRTEVLDLGELAGEILGLVRASASKDIAFELRVDEGDRWLRGDGAQLRQVLLNLLTNAAEAIGESVGKVVVWVCGEDLVAPVDVALGEELPAGRYVRCTVIDDGCGMAASEQLRMFDPFYSSKFTGRGLGMSTVLGIVRSHDGGIRVWSERGQGTRITVWLPRIAAGARQSGEGPRKAVPAAPDVEFRARVLVVDDEDVVLRSTARLLQRLGCEVTAVGGGSAALEQLAGGYPFDVVLLDWTMPMPDGRAVLHRCRELRPELPVVVTSGYQDEDAFDDTDRAVAAGFVAKPFARADLVGELRRAVDARSST